LRRVWERENRFPADIAEESTPQEWQGEVCW
jgi:hypothetical protein